MLGYVYIPFLLIYCLLPSPFFLLHANRVSFRPTILAVSLLSLRSIITVGSRHFHSLSSRISHNSISLEPDHTLIQTNGFPFCLALSYYPTTLHFISCMIPLPDAFSTQFIISFPVQSSISQVSGRPTLIKPRKTSKKSQVNDTDQLRQPDMLMSSRVSLQATVIVRSNDVADEFIISMRNCYSCCLTTYGCSIPVAIICSRPNLLSQFLPHVKPCHLMDPFYLKANSLFSSFSFAILVYLSSSLPVKYGERKSELRVSHFHH